MRAISLLLALGALLGTESLCYAWPMARDRNGWTPTDYDALVAMARNQGAPADWFAAVMASESDLRAFAQNPSGAQGLIQFAGLGTNITGWTPAQQMPLVAKYYTPYRPVGGWVSRAQIYQANYLPATIAQKGSAPGTVLARRGAGDGFYQGAIFDKTGKGYTTVQDLELRLRDKTKPSDPQWQAALAGIRAAGGDISTSPTRSGAPSVAWIIVGGLALGAVATYAFPRLPTYLPARRLRAA